MKSMNFLLRKKSLRYFLLGIGFAAVFALTGMNVYSLYDIRDQMTIGKVERQMALLDDLIRDIRLKVLNPFLGLNKIELKSIETTLKQTEKFPPQLQEKIVKAASSSVFNDIYYTPENNAHIYTFNSTTNSLKLTNNYPPSICDGVGLARTKARIELNTTNYKWNNNVEFDTHRTMNIGLINVQEHKIIGYLTTTLNKNYIVDELIHPLISTYFNPDSVSGTVLWLHDWANDVVLATNDPSATYDYDIVDKRKPFGLSMFENWNIKVAFSDTEIASAYNSTLLKNMFALGVAVMCLVSAFLFMFVTAQRERALVLRQTGFLANVTHELKTPLAVMQAAGENISDGRVMDKERLMQYGNHIYTEAIRLRKMIDKLLDVAKNDSSKTIAKALPVLLNDAVNRFISENKSYIEGSGFTIKINLSKELPVILIDENHLEQILNNLIENAIKFSSDIKTITLSVTATFNEAILKISDSGLGIPKEHLKNIFKKFYRIEDSLNAKTKGHGLGLNIVKDLIKLNKAKIKVVSEVGSGTTFIIRFPRMRN